MEPSLQSTITHRQPLVRPPPPPPPPSSPPTYTFTTDSRGTPSVRLQFSATATEPCPYASVWPASATSVTWLSRPSNSQAVVQVSTTTATIGPPPLPSVDAAPPSYVPAIITSYASATVCPQAPSSTRLPPQISSATSLRLSASTNSHAASSTAAAAATIQDHPGAFSAAASLSLLAAAAATIQLVMCLNACISILVKVYPLYRMMQCRL
ncbi:hypothetical protein B296_00058612 [Ensete ventricosum]|uniref:Uncharacterized protein n=1 Tax=Ensete ventricosum TaxID=4639 RepID=A0A426X744_ENSVE|nr:hypothetical protein B296_00058612 [Ensete ventricosum]